MTKKELTEEEILKKKEDKAKKNSVLLTMIHSILIFIMILGAFKIDLNEWLGFAIFIIYVFFCCLPASEFNKK